MMLKKKEKEFGKNRKNKNMKVYGKNMKKQEEAEEHVKYTRR